MRLIITGGAGFIGSAVARAALADPRIEEIVVVDTFDSGLEENLAGLDVEVTAGSIDDARLMSKVLRRDDAVIHLAARPSVPLSIADPLATNVVNVSGTLSLLESCRQASVACVMVASSSSVYGSNPALPKREDAWLGPLSPYAVSKLATETYAIAYQSSFGLRTAAFRFFNVYGPRQRSDGGYPAVIPSFIDALLTGRPVTIYGDGEQTRDFTFVDNVARVLIESALRGLCESRPINLAFGDRTSLNAVLNSLEKLTGVTARREYTDVRAGDIRHSHASADTLKQLFPDLQRIALEDGLSRTLDWSQQRAGSR